MVSCSASRAAREAVSSDSSRVMRADRSWRSVWPLTFPSASLFRAAAAPSSSWMRLLAPRVSDSIWAERLFSCSSSSCWDDDWRSRSATTLSQWAASPSAFRMASSHSRSWLWAVSIS